MSALIQVKADGTFRRIAVDDTPPELSTLQELVGGDVQAIYAAGFAVLVNEESLLHNRFRPNPHIGLLLSAHGRPGYSILGEATILISGDEDLMPLPDEVASSLSDELIQLGCIETEDRA